MADFALGTAELGVIVNLDGLQKGINEAQQKAGDGFTVMGGTIANVLGNAISAAGGVVLNQVGNIFGAINAGVASNIQFETYETQFGVLLKTTDEFKSKAQGISDPLQQQAIAAEMAKTRISELAAFGAATPFDLPGVVEADKILQGFGLHSQESADKFGYSGTQIRTIAGDVASGTGQNFQDIALYLGKFASGATGEAISRFQELGITTREELSNMGIQFSKSGELTSPLPEAMNTILGVMQTKFGGMMNAQSSTLEGMMSNFGDWKEGALRTLAAPIFDVIKNSMSGFLAFTTANAPLINSTLTSIGQTIGSVLGAAIEFIATTIIPAFKSAWISIAPVLQTVSGYVNTAITVFRQISSAFSTPGISSASTALGTLATAAATSGSSFDRIATSIRPMAPAISTAQSAFTALSSAITSMSNAAMPVFNNLVNVVTLTIRSIIAAISQNSSLISATFTSTWNTILSVTSTVFNAVMGVVGAVLGVVVNLLQTHGTSMMTTVITVWSSISNAVSSIITAIAGFISVVFGQIAAWINANQETIANTIATVWNTIGAIISGVAQIIGAVVSFVFNAMSSFVTAHSAQIQSTITIVWNIVTGIITTALNFILGIVNAVLAMINGNWQGAWEIIKQTCANLLLGVRDIIVNALEFIASLFGTTLENIGTTWSGAWEGIKAAASTIWESVKSTAQGFIDGLVGIIQGAVENLKGAAQAGLDAILGIWNGFTDWAGIGGDVIDGIIKGITGGIGALKDAVTGAASSALDAAKRALGIASPSKRFADEVGEPSALGILDGFMRAFPGVNINIIKGIATLMENVAKIAEDGAKALAVLSEFKGSSNTGLGAFLASIQDIATRFAALADELGGRVLGTANRFSESAGKVVELIKNAVESINALEDFIIPTKDSIGRFGYTLSLVVGNIAYIASFFQQKSIDSGAAFAKGAKDMLAIVKDAIEAFIEIPNVVDVSRDAVARFGSNLTLIVSMFVDIVRNWNSASVTTAATFAESVGKIIGIIGNAVEAFTKLSTISAVPLRAFGDFQVNLWQLLGYLHTLAQSWPTEAMDSMAVFGDGITKVIGFIGTALDNFVKLNDFQGIAERNITNFYLAMWNTMRYLHTLAQSWPKEAMSIMATFGDGVIKTISYIGTAIDNLNRLKDIQVVPERALNDFQIAMWNTLLRLHTLAQNFPSEAVSIMAVFGEGIGKAIGVISTAVEQFTKLRDFTGIPADAIQAFATGLTQTIQALANSAATIGSAATAAAKLLADGIGNSLDIIGKAVDAFTKLQEFKTIPQTTILAFVDTLWRVVEELEQASEYFTQAGYAAAKALNDGIGDSLSVIGKAVDGFTKLKDFQVVPQKTILAFVDTLGRVFEELVQASEYFNEAAYSAAKSLADGIGSSISVISTAIDQFAKLLDFKAPSKDAMITFVNALKSTVSAMTNLVLPASEDIGVQLIQGIIKGIQSQVAALSKALDDAMGQALDSIKVTLGIASPSKVFEEQVGTNIAAGIASGMNKITEPNFGGLLAATDNFRSASVAMAANTPLTSNNASYTEQYNVYASYKHQEESTIRDDLRMVHMLRGR